MVADRGDDAVAKVMELTDDVGVDAALECIGTDQFIETAAGVTRAGGMIGAVGVPLHERFDNQSLFWKNVGIKGGVAPAGSTSPSCSTASSPATSIPVWSSTSPPTSTTSPRPTRAGTSAAPSSSC
jgi:threonine dehydrogenase-like Zn-dependent dehydrogenase